MVSRITEHRSKPLSFQVSTSFADAEISGIHLLTVQERSGPARSPCSDLVIVNVALCGHGASLARTGLTSIYDKRPEQYPSVCTVQFDVARVSRSLTRAACSLGPFPCCQTLIGGSVVLDQDVDLFLSNID